MMLFTSICCGALVILLSSCSTNRSVKYESLQGIDVISIEYSIVCVIHGDSDYLYHDTGGNEFKADEEALVKAKRVAQQNPRAEVFIFHQRPRRHFLLFFPIHDGEFYYYRNGRLIANELYWRDQEESRFEPEMDFYRRFCSGNKQKTVSLFLYYGHEIPEVDGTDYDESYSDRTFTVHDLADGLKGFTRDSARFDLMVISSCYSGTPYTIGALGSFARYIIASPDNLHLSYFDFHLLERLDHGLRDGDMSAFAKRFAVQAFNRLTRDLQTAVSIAVYDVDRVQPYLKSIDSIYNYTLAMLNEQALESVEHCDCAEEPGYTQPWMSDGVDVFYRPARFGRSKHKQNHSGWECWREKKTTESSLTDR